jgi:hypothetical protein
MAEGTEDLRRSTTGTTSSTPTRSGDVLPLLAMTALTQNDGSTGSLWPTAFGILFGLAGPRGRPTPTSLQNSFVSHQRLRGTQSRLPRKRRIPTNRRGGGMGRREVGRRRHRNRRIDHVASGATNLK